jgi:enoyl-[acyl-carrier protein] reductase II
MPSVQVDPRLPVIPVRALKNKGTEAFTAKQVEVANRLNAGEIDMGEAQLAIEHFWAGALRRAVIDGDVENGSVMAGQSVGMVTREEPVAEIIAELMQQAEAALGARATACHKIAPMGEQRARLALSACFAPAMATNPWGQGRARGPAS